jgi:hypothetical protein
LLTGLIAVALQGDESGAYAATWGLNKVGATVNATSPLKGLLARRLRYFFVAEGRQKRIYLGEYHPILRNFFVCALEERFACLRRTLFGVVCSPSTNVPF